MTTNDHDEADVDRTGMDAFATWVGEHAVTLAGLDPAADLDDLESLRDIVGEAQVVAVGENSHFIREFALLRHRILRWLVERCGFRMLAFESGFSEGFALDRWAQGEGETDDLDHLAEGTIASGLARPRQVGDTLRWLREHNDSTGQPVRFVGVDVPSAAGSLLPALQPMVHELAEVDPAALPTLESAIVLAGEISGRTMAHAAPAYLAFPAAHQDALTATLARLADRFDTLAARYVAASNRDRIDTARWRLEGARAADHHLRGVAAALTETALPGAASTRDRYMAASIDWWLERAAPDTRIVVFAHNAHIQRTPVVHGGEFQALPMGAYLDERLGSDYVALGVTSGSGHTAALYPAADAEPYGFTVEDTALDPPEPTSIEAAFAAAGLGGPETGPSLLDLGDARRHLRSSGANRSGPDRTRMDTDYVHTPVLEAFDAVIHVPRTEVATDLGF